jgi:hypothetical protein
MAEHVISLLIIADDDATDGIMPIMRALVHAIEVEAQGQRLELTLKLDTEVLTKVQGD